MWRGFKSCGSHCGHPSLGKAEGDLSRQANEKDGYFALLLAAAAGHEAVVRVLLEAGADAKQVASAECCGAEFGGVLGSILLIAIILIAIIFVFVLHVS